jgi:hypothetical protein
MTGHRGGRRSRQPTQATEGSNTMHMSAKTAKVVPTARTQVSVTPNGESGYQPTFERDNSSNSIVVGDRIKFSGSNVWTDVNGKPLDLLIRYLVMRAFTGLQRWVNKDGKRVPEVIVDKPLPDPDVLNARIPKETWEIGKHDGKPKAPWSKIWVLHLVNPINGQMFTYVNSTRGTEIAYGKLMDQVFAAKSLRGGADVVPAIQLSTKPMKTQFGDRERPHYEVVGLRNIGQGALAVTQAVPQIEHQPVEDDFYDDGTGDL